MFSLWVAFYILTTQGNSREECEKHVRVSFAQCHKLRDTQLAILMQG